MKYVIPVLLSALSAFAAAAQDVRSAATGWAEAVAKRDKATLERLLADDLEFVHPGGVSIQTKAQYIAAITEGARDYEAFIPRDLMVRDFGNAAAVSGYVAAKLRTGDSITVRLTQLYVQNNGQWQLAASLGTPLADRGARPQRRTGDPAGAVRDAASAWVQAVAGSDKPALEKILRSDLYFALPDGSVQTRAQYIASVTGSAIGRESLALTGDVAIHVYGNTAVLSGRADGRGGASNPTRYLQLYVVNDGQWQLACSAATTVSTANPSARRKANNAADPAEAAVRETALVWTQAVVSRDHAALRPLLREDLIFGHSGGRPPQNKDEFVNSDENNDYDALPLRDIRIRIYGKTAMLSSYLDTKHRGRPTNPVRALQIFTETGGRWQLAAFQSARIIMPESERSDNQTGPLAGEIQAVQRAAEGWTHAMVQRNKAALTPLLAADLIFVHSNGSTIQNQVQYLAASERATYESLPLSDVNTRIYEKTAVLTAYIDTKNVGRDPFRVRTLQVFVKNGGQWQLAAFQSTRVTSEH
jgi:ketosteroid isomerase-like protein